MNNDLLDDPPSNVDSSLKPSKVDEFNDQNELDYEDEDETKLKSNQLSKLAGSKSELSPSQNVENDSDGEIKSENGNDDATGDLDDDGELLPSPKNHEFVKSDVIENNNDEAVDLPKSDDEEGEINDGEKSKKTFIPRVLCKYYQRGKCTWGRTCKFLHPGVNDTGNYTFLEFEDPTLKAFQQQQISQTREENASAELDSNAMIVKDAVINNTTSIAPRASESAWERGLRHAKEMKEKALKRKQKEKDEFMDKKMNLSLKEFENEKENDERYINVERTVISDNDIDDEEMHLLERRQLNTSQNRESRGGGGNQSDRSKYPNNRENDFYTETDNHHHNNNRSNNNYQPRKRDSRSPPQNKTASSNAASSNSYNRPNNNNNNRADEWHDPWERSRQQQHDHQRNTGTTVKSQGQQKNQKGGGRTTDSSDSDSRSKSSRSRSSYSSSSSRSSSFSTDDDSRSRSNKPLANNGTKKPINPPRKSTINNHPQNTSLKNNTKPSTTASKDVKSALPGRQVSNFSLKRATADISSSSISNAKKRNRTRSNSSTSTLGSKSDDDQSDDDDDDSDDSDHDSKSKLKRKSFKKSEPPPQKSKMSSTIQNKGPTKLPDKDKKQMIKDQLKLLEDALKKKNSKKT